MTFLQFLPSARHICSQKVKFDLTMQDNLPLPQPRQPSLGDLVLFLWIVTSVPLFPRPWWPAGNFKSVPAPPPPVR